jgi:transcription elongation factor/antiterminator RfaH
MASFGTVLQIADAAQVLQATETERWYALQTKARHEKVVKERLEKRGVEIFLPTVTEIHRWSDRKKKVEVPLFSCYLFVRLAPTKMDRLRILCLEGVFRFVGHDNAGLPIPDEQIETVRSLVDSQVPCTPYPFFKAGQRVRISNGSLKGVEGVLVSQNGDHTVVISVDAIQRSLAVKVEGYKLEAV